MKMNSLEDYSSSFKPLYEPFGQMSDNDVSDERVWRVETPGYYQFIRNTKNCIIIIPGGAYLKWNPLLNGINYAEQLTIDCYVLVPTLPRGNPDLPFNDLKKLYLKLSTIYKQVGIMGNSAGGHMAAMMEPDFRIVINPVVSMISSWTHDKSRQNLLAYAIFSKRAQWSPETIKQSPIPTFIAASTDDQTVSVQNSRLYYELLSTQGVPVEAHFFATGGHYIDPARWLPLLKTWLHAEKYY